MKHIAVIFATVLLAGCVSSPYRESTTYGAQDKAAFQPIVKEHLRCMGAATRLYINGSSDVAFLTEHIAKSCDPILARLSKGIQSRGFSPEFAYGYVKQSRDDAKQITASGILKLKSGEEL